MWALELEVVVWYWRLGLEKFVRFDFGGGSGSGADARVAAKICNRESGVLAREQK